MSVKLTVRFSGPESEIEMAGYGLKAEVTAAEGLSRKIFVMHRRVPSATDSSAAAVTDEFVHLASPLDLESVPEDAPTEAVPYYRTDTVEFVFTSMADLAETKALLDTQLKLLVAAVKAIGELSVQEEVTYE